MISKTREQIERLPKPPPQNALNEVAKLIKDFDADVRRHIEGVPYKEGIIQRIRIPQEKFCRAIRATAPDFRPSDRPRVPEARIEASPYNHMQNEYSTNHFSSPRLEVLRIEEEDPQPEVASEDVYEAFQGEQEISQDEHEVLQDEYETPQASAVIYIDEVQRRMNEQVHLFHLISSEIDR